jgi:hypothetical protein
MNWLISLVLKFKAENLWSNHDIGPVLGIGKRIILIISDYITLNYCDNFVVMWIISWFGCDTWSKFMNYREKYGTLLEELVCLGASFNIERGNMHAIFMDGTYENKTKRISLGWNKESYAFITPQESINAESSQINNDNQTVITSKSSGNFRIKLRVNRS